MKTPAVISLFACLLTINVFSQTGPEYLTLTATSVTNLATQPPVSMIMEFSNTGSDSYDQFDTTSVGVPPDTTNASLSLPRSLYPFTVSFDNTYLDYYDSRPVIQGSTIYNFGIYSEINDSVRISASAFIDTAANLSNNGTINNVYLEDIYSGNFYQVLNNTATVPVYSSATFNDPYTMCFRLHIIIKPTVIAYGVTCSGNTNGSIGMHTPAAATGWNYTIYQNGNPVQSSFPGVIDTTISGLTAGNYSVVIYESGLLADSEEVIVSSPAPIIAQFTPDTYNAYTNNPVSFTNGSSGASAYAWSFGDSSSDTVSNPSHSFLSTGDFAVTLTASNANGCSASFTDTIHVTSAPMAQGPHFSTMLFDPSNNPSLSGDATLREANWHDPVLTTSAQKITITQQGEAQKMQVTVLSANGQLIRSVSSADSTVEFDVPAAGIYIVVTSFENGKTSSEKIMVN